MFIITRDCCISGNCDKCLLQKGTMRCLIGMRDTKAKAQRLCKVWHKYKPRYSEKGRVKFIIGAN